MKHTPGPWTLEYDYSLVMPAKDGNHIVTAGPIGPDESSREEKRANARLIAASPELLEILIELVRLIEYPKRSLIDRDGDMIQKPSLKKAKKSIQKATQP